MPLLQPKGDVGQTHKENPDPVVLLLALLSLSATNPFSQNKDTKTNSGSPGTGGCFSGTKAIEKVLSMCCPRRLTLHYYAQNAVDARLVAFAMALKPSEHVLIQANRQLLFHGGPRHRRLLEKGLVEPRNVRIVNIAILHTVNPCQVALDRFSVHVDFPFSWR
jgi:hypothetical protein